MRLRNLLARLVSNEVTLDATRSVFSRAFENIGRAIFHFAFPSLWLSQEEAKVIHERLVTSKCRMRFSGKINIERFQSRNDYLSFFLFKGMLIFMEGVLVPSDQREDYSIRIEHKAIVFRPNLKGFERMISEEMSKVERGKNTPIYVLSRYYSSNVGDLKVETLSKTPCMIDRDFFDKISRDISLVIRKKRTRTGAILYGEPGNGKSFFISQMAAIHRLPIYYVKFEVEYDNFDIMNMISRVASPSVIVFEEFDCIFEGRKPVNPKTKFGIEMLLNILDGVFPCMDGTVCFLTTNKISSVDTAMRRPSRFRYFYEFKPPSKEKINEILFDVDLKNKPKIIRKMKGLNLNAILELKQCILEGEVNDGNIESQVKTMWDRQTEDIVERKKRKDDKEKELLEINNNITPDKPRGEAG